MAETKVTETVAVSKFANDLGMEIVYAGRGMMTLSSKNVTRPGLQLAGFLACYDFNQILMIGLTEYEYIRGFASKDRKTRFSKLFDFGEVPCIILARDLPVLPELAAAARKAGCPILRSSKLSTSLINDLYIYLNEFLAPTTRMHGVLLDVFGVGILITGHSGVGKSETAMELIKRGHRLAADDSVLIKNVANELYGSSPDKIRYFMELRGIGIINVKNMYGSGSVMDEKKIELVVELENWAPDKEYDRLDGSTYTEEILSVTLPKLVIPVTPGRNLAIIIEVAARNFRLKEMGYDAANELVTRAIGR